MRLYSVHHCPSGRTGRWSADPDPDLVLVKEGFSWPALFVPLLWALYHRLWLGIAAYVALMAGLGLVTWLTGLDETGEAILALALALLVAMSANDWRRWTLARAGYRLIGVVAGRNLVAAEHRVFTTAGGGAPVS